MGAAKKHKPVKLIVGMISNDPELFFKTEKILERPFGPVDFRTSLLDFAFTDYYEPEMGKNLKRQFISFRRLVNPENLPQIKLYSGKLELKFSVSRKAPSRRINIDPGYVTDAKFVLATTKDNQHRIYLGKGIFGEITLKFTDKTFLPWEWTYRDYQTKEYVDIFNEIRKIYMHSLK
ncbi:MAG: DUF4416 family protein [Candidatus Omnitrophota bacterium]